MKKLKLNIGNIEFDAPFFAAPMAGITDMVMRTINAQMGASLCYSEMVSGKGLLYNNKKTEDLLAISPDETKVAYQIFGAEPEVMAKTAQLLNDRKNDILDINMGCPVPKVVKNGEGSALLKEPALVYDIVKSVVNNTDKPVTVKIRMGWDDNNINCVDIAKIIEKAGASAVALHGRTREQYYTGKANWQAIKEVKENVEIPVIGNGDIFTAADVMQMLEKTGCDFVMIGRGMLGNPWIFRECMALWNDGVTLAKPTLEEKKQMMLRHLEDECVAKGEKVAVREMRKFIAWYTKGMHGSAKFRTAINSIDDVGELKAKIQSLL